MPKKITSKQIILAILAFVTVNLLAGYGTVILGIDIPGIYATLNKPSFAPPTWVFGSVWTFNTILFTYGFLVTLNSPDSIARTNLLRIDYLIILNYIVFQYLSFGSGLLFGAIIPAMFFWPTFSMLVLVILAIIQAYKIDTSSTTFSKNIKSLQSITCSFLPLVSWLLIATALGLSIWLKN